MKPKFKLLQTITNLEKQLTTQTSFTNALEREAAELRSKFDNGEFNSKASFSEAREILDAIRRKQKEVSVSNGVAFRLRQQIEELRRYYEKLNAEA